MPNPAHNDPTPETTPLAEETEELLLGLEHDVVEVAERELVEIRPLHLEHQRPPRWIEPRFQTDEEHNVAIAVEETAEFNRDAANFEADMAGKSITVVASEAAEHGLGVSAAMDVLDGSVTDTPWSKDSANPLNQKPKYAYSLIPPPRDTPWEFEAYALLDKGDPDPIRVYNANLEALRKVAGITALVNQWQVVAVNTAHQLNLRVAFMPNGAVFHTRLISEEQALDLARRQFEDHRNLERARRQIAS